ncbi:MAG TPA: hypothetical protein VHB97_20280 [Polyangia bacterium]|jgi:hypothetical protein|nr:hypothetical protein [Polyangia bacterium]
METTTTRKPSLPVVLENIRIATPCAADWDDMRGDDRVRFCGKCDKNVYNLSAMTRDEGEALVREKEGRLCVRLYQRADGTVITNDCPVGVRRARLRARVWASVSGAAASLALVLGLFGGRARADLTVDGKKPTGKPPEVNVRVMGGAVAMPTPPPEKHLMGKIAIKPQPAPPKPVQGEPAPIMGDIAVNKVTK